MESEGFSAHIFIIMASINVETTTEGHGRLPIVAPRAANTAVILLCFTFLCFGHRRRPPRGPDGRRALHGPALRRYEVRLVGRPRPAVQVHARRRAGHQGVGSRLCAGWLGMHGWGLGGCCSSFSHGVWWNFFLFFSCCSFSTPTRALMTRFSPFLSLPTRRR